MYKRQLLQEPSEQREESEQPEILEELAQPEHSMNNPPILQTPLYEEKNPKRDREEATPSIGLVAQAYVKRQRLNPF